MSKSLFSGPYPTGTRLLTQHETSTLAAAYTKEVRQQQSLREEAKKVMKLPTLERKDYYVNVERKRGLQEAKDLSAEVRQQRQNQQGMER